jgi:hypothetical protein
MGEQHRAARRFSRPAPLLRWWTDKGGLREPADALVFGAGLMVEAEELRRRGWRTDAIETAKSISRRQELYSGFSGRPGCRVLAGFGDARKKYDLILVTHVLEFVEDPSERTKILRHLRKRLKSDGYLLLSLRGWADVARAKTQTPTGDGIVTGIGTWTRGYSVEEADDLLDGAGLEATQTPNPKSKVPTQVRLVCRAK